MMLDYYRSDIRRTVINTFIGVCIYSGFFVHLIHQSREVSIRFAGHTMATTYNITIAEELPGHLSEVSLKAKIDAELNRIDKSLTTYDETSDLSIINHNLSPKVAINSEIAFLLRTALEISALSDGYYDITVLPLVELWGFGKKPVHPQLEKSLENHQYEQLLKQEKIVVGYRNLEIRKEILEKRDPQIKIDLSSIAQGYAVDKITQLLEENQIHNFLVELSGEIVVRGLNPHKKKWRIGIEAPDLEELETTKEVYTAIILENLALATSGDYRNFKKFQNRKYGHTFDPKTRLPIKHNLASVSVIAKTCTEADAWATALMSLGFEKGLALVEKLKMPAYFIVAQGDPMNSTTFKAIASSRWQKTVLSP